MTSVRLSLRATTRVDIPGIERLKNVVSSPAQRTELLNKWADDYFASMHARHNLLSTGAGSWPPLKPATIKRRAQRKKNRPKRGNHAILADQLQLLGATRKKGGPGQVRYLSPQNFAMRIGIGGPTAYRDPTDRDAPRTLGQLAALQSKPSKDGNRPARAIIVPPNNRTIQKMETAASVWLLKRFKGK